MPATIIVEHELMALNFMKAKAAQRGGFSTESRRNRNCASNTQISGPLVFSFPWTNLKCSRTRLWESANLRPLSPLLTPRLGNYREGLSETTFYTVICRSNLTIITPPVIPSSHLSLMTPNTLIHLQALFHRFHWSLRFKVDNLSVNHLLAHSKWNAVKNKRRQKVINHYWQSLKKRALVLCQVTNQTVVHFISFPECFKDLVSGSLWTVPFFVA